MQHRATFKSILPYSVTIAFYIGHESDKPYEPPAREPIITLIRVGFNSVTLKSGWLNETDRQENMQSLRLLENASIQEDALFICFTLLGFDTFHANSRQMKPVTGEMIKEVQAHPERYNADVLAVIDVLSERVNKGNAIAAWYLPNIELQTT